MKIALLSVVYFKSSRQFYFAEETLLSAKSTQHQLEHIGIINYASVADKEKIAPHYTVLIDNDKNNLSRAWNKGIRCAWERGADYIIICNLDIIFRADTIDNLVSAAQERPEALIWSALNCESLEGLTAKPTTDKVALTANFSCFMIDKRFTTLIGDFDERFEPAYFEDADIIRRVMLAEQPFLLIKSSVVSHFRSSTINSLALDHNFTELDTINDFIKTNEARYIHKWGGIPGQETFTTPREIQVKA
jgi:GT2 family glycosyltransferase